MDYNSSDVVVYVYQVGERIYFKKNIPNARAIAIVLEALNNESDDDKKSSGRSMLTRLKTLFTLWRRCK